MNNNDEATQLRIQYGKEWLQKIFGESNVKEGRRMGVDALEVHIGKLLRQGATTDDVIERLNKYIRDRLDDPKFVAFHGVEPGTIILPLAQFGKVGVVNSLARLHSELLELVLLPEFPYTPSSPVNSKSEDSSYDLRELMPDVPVSAPKPPVQPVSATLALATLEEATGVKWMSRQMGLKSYYSTVQSYINAEDLSLALRGVLGSRIRDLPHLEEGSGKVMIPASYIDFGNLGMLAASRDILKPQFGGRSTGVAE